MLDCRFQIPHLSSRVTYFYCLCAFLSRPLRNVTPLSPLIWADVHKTATTVPVPSWPGLLAYPGFVLIITIEGVFPEIVFPDLVIVLAAITAINDGTRVGDP